jgi:hypothetical protein
MLISVSGPQVTAVTLGPLPPGLALPFVPRGQAAQRSPDPALLLWIHVRVLVAVEGFRKIWGVLQGPDDPWTQTDKATVSICTRHTALAPWRTSPQASE